MPDYNLYGLSTRSFEQLIQSIAANVIGPGTVVFGDGPDGGREAVFDGKTQYPSLTDPWDGYVVVQAKFRQRPQGVETDGSWALGQLSKELKKFTSKKRNLRRPEYYIFCTNVVLTPPEKAGSKDRSYILLEQHATKHGLKGFAIWDCDQIRTYLDNLPGIRQAYQAWITAGDVLAAVCHAVQWSHPDFETVMTTFLQKELLADQYVNLEQAGHAADERTPMARVFMDLPAVAQPSGEPPNEETGGKRHLPPGFVQDILTAGAQRVSVLTHSSVSPNSQDGDVLAGRFVLVGGPGQGKTTVSQFICQLHRASILSARSSTILSREARAALDEIGLCCRSGDTPWPTCRRFPVRIVLNHFAKELSSQHDGSGSLISYVARRIRNRTDQDVTVKDLKQWLKIYPWFLVLDGLDEVPASSNRDDVLTAIQEFWVDAAECQADILVLATTRPQGYEQDFSPTFYTHRYLAPLSRARALQYGSWLAAARYGNDKDREQRIVARLRRASAEDATAKLMRSPLQVTIIATLVDQTGQPPRERWRLFHEYYEVIYKREMERDIPAANILREHKSNIDGIHSQVGLILQTESETAGQTDARLTSAAFGKVVTLRLKTEGYQGETLRALERQIIEAATHRLVFLVGMEADQVGFEIRSLQEFMAAEALTDQTDAVVTDRLNATASVAHWRNVFLFAAGKCFAVRQHLRDSILAICATLNEHPEDETSRRTLLGSQLALDLLVDGAANQQPKFERSLARVALRLVERPSTWLPNNVADAYQASTEEVFREELSGRLSAPTATNVWVWPILLGLVERGVEWATNLADQNWPSDAGRRAEILAEYIAPVLPDSPVRSAWIKSKLLELVPQIPMVTAVETGFLWQEMTRPVPAWIHSFVKLMGRFRAERVIRLSDVDLTVNELRSSARLSAWGATAEMSCHGQGWCMVSYVREFARAPSAAQLGQALRQIGKDWDKQTVDVLMNFSPWPLVACLRSCWVAEDAENLARRAENGELGDTRQWLRAEERWGRGISLEDIVASDNHEDLPGPHLEGAGFCLGGARLAGVRFEGEEAGLELFRLLSQIRTPSLRSVIAGIVENVVLTGNNVGARKKLRPWLNPTGLAGLFGNPGGTISLDGLLPVIETYRSDPSLMGFLDLVGRNRTLWIGRSPVDHGLYERICRAWVECPHLEGLLPVLACWVTGGGNCSFMIEALDSYQCSEPRFGAAALLLQIAHGDPERSKCEAIAAKVVEYMADERFDACRTAITLAERGRLKPAVATHFLLALYRLLATSNWLSLYVVMSGLDDIVRRRHSRLNELGVQQALRVEYLSAAVANE